MLIKKDIKLILIPGRKSVQKRKNSEKRQIELYRNVIKTNIIAQRIKSKLWTTIHMPEIYAEREEEYYEKINEIKDMYIKKLSAQEKEVKIIWCIEPADYIKRKENIKDLMGYNEYLNYNKMHFHFVYDKVITDEYQIAMWVETVREVLGYEYKKITAKELHTRLPGNENQTKNLIAYMSKLELNLFPEIMPIVSFGICPETLEKAINNNSELLAEAFIEILQKKRIITVKNMRELAKDEVINTGNTYEIIRNLNKLLKLIGYEDDIKKFKGINAVLKKVEKKITSKKRVKKSKKCL